MYLKKNNDSISVTQFVQWKPKLDKNSLQERLLKFFGEIEPTGL